MITGASGMVGHDLVSALKLQDEDVVALGKRELDITDQKAVERAADEAKPSIIVNCAAYTKVDDAETNEVVAMAVNGSSVGHLVHVADRHHALLVQISTDFVFDGQGRSPYTITDRTGPLSSYGRSKLVGEQEAARAGRNLIIRTAWLFGRHGPNFVESIRNQVRKGNRALQVVNDQRGRPTYTPHLAEAIVRLARATYEQEEARGVIHYADSPECTWFDFARAIVEEMQERGEAPADVSIAPVTTDQFPRPARRPAYSVLSTERYERITGVAPDSWREGLADYFG